jgi:hypothetical protein
VPYSTRIGRAARRAIPLAAAGLAIGALIGIGTASSGSGASDGGKQGTAAASVADGTQYVANINGAQQVPPVHTPATGSALFKVDDKGKALRYKIKIKNIRGLTELHIHLGKRGQNGDTVVGFIAVPPPGVGRAIESAGYITSANLIGPMTGMPIGALIQKFQTKSTYVNAHTAKVDGLIRGQIVPTR